MVTFARFSSRVITSPKIAVVTGIVLIVATGFGVHLLRRNVKHRMTSPKQAAINAPGGSAVANRVLARGPDLEDISVVHHGRIIEVKGGTESGAIVMINGEPAATFFDGNQFKHFVGPMLPGTSIVTITAQDDSGGVTTRQLAVTIE